MTNDEKARLVVAIISQFQDKIGGTEVALMLFNGDVEMASDMMAYCGENLKTARKETVYVRN